METICVVAICVAAASLILSAVAWWRAGGRGEVASLRQDLARHAEALKQRVRIGYEDSLARIRLAEERLARVREETSAEARQSIDALRAHLAQARSEIDASLTRLKGEVSTRTEAAEQAIRARILRMEGHVQLLSARAEMVRAERRAEKRDFIGAIELLEKAIARVNEVKLRLSDRFEDDPQFADVLGALHDAIRSVRAEAADHKRDLERAVLASDVLMRSVAAGEEARA
ncbi:MAG: hypothetical protein JWN44_3467 [Myxococcales bacterium]|nr:hypothetical protein [Myxococcales bacterium]